MILPIVAYGDPVLKKEAEEIDENYPDLQKLIADMFETMYHAKGVGLAAPQIGKSIRLFIVDGSPFADEEDDEPDPKAAGIENFKKVFINPKNKAAINGHFKKGVYRYLASVKMSNAKSVCSLPTTMKTGTSTKNLLMAMQPELFNMNTTTSKAFFSPTT